MIQAWTREDNPDWENEWDQGHYTVCIGYDKNRLFFSDPANIKKTWLSNGDLNSRWHGWDDNGKRIGHWGLLFLNKSKYSHDEVEEMG
jgi:ABC-type bacteriocin/lantibiotic exporter with double-glycine peptidase domain